MNIRTQRELLDLPFDEIWFPDFEYRNSDGEHPEPVYLVAWELRTGRRVYLGRDEMGASPPYDISPRALFVFFAADADLECHLSLDWKFPANVIDLRPEFLQVINVTPRPPRDKKEAWGSLLHASTYYGLDAIDAAEKEQWRELILRGGPYTAEQWEAIKNYCEGDVRATVRLAFAMIQRGHIPLDHRFNLCRHRGRCMRATARMEFTGVPIDLERYDRLLPQWEPMRMRLIESLGKAYGVYDEDGSFSHKRFARYLNARGWIWPRTETGRLKTDEKTFRRMALTHPELEDLRQLKYCLEQLDLHKITVGRDGFARCWLAPFASRTSRFQPSNARFIFGPAIWIRCYLIQAKPGWAVVYLDWKAQEFGIAAGLSGDQAMQADYLAEDVYLAFAKRARLVPAWATTETHSLQRDQCKICVLATQYGQKYKALSEQINQPDIVGRELLRHHHKAYRQFWAWSDNRVNRYLLNNKQETVFGWTHHFKQRPKTNSVRNFDMQANAAEMLRLACCLGTEGGISICAPVHDAILIQAPLDRLDEDIARMTQYMTEASRVVLGGFCLRTDQHIFRYPEHYSDPKGRGRRMLETVMGFL